MATVDGEDDVASLKPRPVMLQIFETTVFAVKKPVKVLLQLVAGVFSLRFLAAFLQIVLEVHAEHEHIAPGWLGAPSGEVCQSAAFCHSKCLNMCLSWGLALETQPSPLVLQSDSYQTLCSFCS